MHHAPAVDYPLIARATVLRWVLAPWTVGALVVGYWSWLAFSDGAWKWVGLAGFVAAALTAAGSFNRIAEGRLDWDGVAWAWAVGSDRSCGTVTVELDLQFLMLLAFVQVGGGRRRVWMFLGGRGPRWVALRRAAFAAQSGVGGDAGGSAAGDGDGVRRA